MPILLISVGIAEGALAHSALVEKPCQQILNLSMIWRRRRHAIPCDFLCDLNAALINLMAASNHRFRWENLLLDADLSDMTTRSSLIDNVSVII